MIVNTQWLMQSLDPPCSHEQLVEVFPRIGLEIEDSHALGQELEAVRIGFIREKTALVPKDSDDDGSDTETNEQMWLCQIEIDPGVMLPIAGRANGGASSIRRR